MLDHCLGIRADWGIPILEFRRFNGINLLFNGTENLDLFV
jgi:hypothetical protein